LQCFVFAVPPTKLAVAVIYDVIAKSCGRLVYTHNAVANKEKERVVYASNMKFRCGQLLI
jgi:hypothetical protein